MSAGLNHKVIACAHSKEHGATHHSNIHMRVCVRALWNGRNSNRRAQSGFVKEQVFTALLLSILLLILQCRMDNSRCCNDGGQMRVIDKVNFNNNFVRMKCVQITLFFLPNIFDAVCEAPCKSSFSSIRWRWSK